MAIEGQMLPFLCSCFYLVLDEARDGGFRLTGSHYDKQSELGFLVNGVKKSECDFVLT